MLPRNASRCYTATCGSAWREDAVEFLGLSSQGRSLTTGTPDEDFVDVGPEHHGYVVTGAGDRDPDLTRIVRAL